MTDESLNIIYRTMTPADYNQVHALWERMQGFALRSLDDSYDYVARFLKRNPNTSVVAECVRNSTATGENECVDDIDNRCLHETRLASPNECNNQIIGSILCGHDGRQAFFYHVCVAPEYRCHGVGREMVRKCLLALRDEKISKASLVAFSENEGGNKFWNRIGWTPRADFNTYEFLLNEENITRFVD